jgi:hypothetical protein
LNHPSDKTKNGTVEHVAREFATVCIGYGQAEPVRDPRRGTNEYLEMRKAEEANRKPGPHDVCVANVWPPTWEVIALPRTNRPCIVYRAGSEVTRFESLVFYTSQRDEKGNIDPLRSGIPHDLIPPSCPRHIIQQFKELESANSPEAITAANERSARTKLDAEARDKQADRTIRQRLGL